MFSTDGTLISESAGPHSGVTEESTLLNAGGIGEGSEECKGHARGSDLCTGHERVGWGVGRVKRLM